MEPAQDGHAIVLPMAWTAHGIGATFSSGGEQNYIISSGLSAALTQIRFGTDVKVLPRFDSTSKELKVEIEAVAVRPVA